MSDFRFANPEWSYAMWLVLATVGLLFWLDWRRGDLLTRFVSAAMQSRLVYRLSRARRWLAIACLGLAGASLVVALMRPQWGLTYREMPRVGAQIMVCLDVSKSMLAEDTAPNRLGRAKAELIDLLSYLDGDQLGLIAFAGRATVLCPLTPDFGFFKLVLDGTGPHSVGRGGTRLEEPIRKALDGFRTESDISRILVLITDGEDHDSHPLDAAQAAAERGVKILAIGFGDEAGSEIFVTDPRTKARTQVRDANGRPVITRLDGQTLREMSLATDGAYIPAGTGALDLKSIYDAHIAPLVRGQLDHRGHAIRREAFQWAVLAGFVFLVAATVIGSGSVKSDLQSPPRVPWVTRSSPPSLARRASLFWLVALLAAQATHAQQVQPAPEKPPAIPADGVVNPPSVDEATPERANEAKSNDPREIYNLALVHIDTDSDRAERMLTDARRAAATDGDVRFRATYNLGWVEVKRADKLAADQPEEALAHLRRAADWFRDAVRLRPNHTDARHNLEVVLRRVLELADSLASKEEQNLTERLDALIGAQRDLVAGARQMVDRVAAKSDPHAVDQFRSDFRQLAIRERKILSDSQALSNTAREESDALGNKKDEERTPEGNVRAAQLTNLLHYIDRANQRIGQARSQMRRRQAARSFRRAAAGLTELKRARDQLRGPVEVLDVILADALSLVQLTSLKAAEERRQFALKDEAQNETVGGSMVGALRQVFSPSTSGAPSREPPPLPWLTREYLEESQLSLTERTTELTDRLRAALEQQETPMVGPLTAEQQEARAAEDFFVTMVREAVPLLSTGVESFQSAGQSLAADEFDEAATRQRQAIAALRDARERFLGLRGLIELTHAGESQIQQLLSPPEPESGEVGDAEREADAPSPPRTDSQNGIPARMQFARRAQADNLDRGERLARLIKKELAALPNPSPEDGGGGQATARRKQLELAQPLLDQAREAMSQVAGLLREPSAAVPSVGAPKELPEAGDPAPIDDAVREESHKHAVRAVEHLQSLRRLFFSIVEHLRETAQRQAELNDETEKVAAINEPDNLAKKTGPLSLRQRELQVIAEQIAQALEEQAAQSPAGGDPQGVDPKQIEQHEQLAEQLVKAAKLVTEGSSEMQNANEQLLQIPGDSARTPPASGASLEEGAAAAGIGAQDADSGTPPDAKGKSQDSPLDDVRQHQDTALRKLVEAIALLQPPPQPQNQNQQDQPADQQPEQKQAEEPDQGASGADMSRLLQAIRDRESQRRQDRERQRRFQPEPVDKDW